MACTIHKIPKTDDDARPWPNGVIPYAIDSIDFAAGGDEEKIILDAVSEVKSKTKLDLRLKVASDEHFAVFIKSKHSCGTFAGFKPDRRRTNITCNVADFGKGSIIHEILHVAGVYHEQSRLDRDDHIKVLFEHITPDWRAQYIKRDSDTQGTAYDYDSVMHYHTQGGSEPWETGWSHLVHVDVGGAPCCLFYNGETGVAKFQRIDRDGYIQGPDHIHPDPQLKREVPYVQAGLLQTWVDDEFGAGWSDIVAVYRLETPYLLCNNSATGAMKVVRIPGNFSKPVKDDTVRSGNWGAGWTHLLPLRYMGAAAFVRTNSANRFEYHLVTGPEFSTTTFRTGSWARETSALVPFRIDQQPYFVHYSRPGGQVGIFRISMPGRPSPGHTCLWQGDFKANLDHVFVGSTDLRFLYGFSKSQNGPINRLLPDGLRTCSGTNPLAYSKLMAYPEIGNPHVIAYEPEDGSFLIGRMTCRDQPLGLQTLWKNGQPGIKVPAGKTAGQRTGLSPLDIQGVDKLYGD